MVTTAVMVIMDTVVVQDATVVIGRYAIQRMDVSRNTVIKLNCIIIYNAQYEIPNFKILVFKCKFISWLANESYFHKWLKHRTISIYYVIMIVFRTNLNMTLNFRFWQLILWLNIILIGMKSISDILLIITACQHNFP